jgi:signal transduction histidine kinase
MDVNRLFEDYKSTLYKRVDHEFAILLPEQWVLCIGCAYFFSSAIQVIIQAALFGALICGSALYFIFRRPGTVASRHAAAVAQLSFSALFIYVLSGRAESHVHVFISLAILASYRDWKVLITASAVTILAHFLYGGPLASHAAWVAFEVVFLGVGCLRALKEMRIVAEAQYSNLQSRLEAENLSSRRTQFFSVVSHEIRTPLNGIIGFTDILRDTPINDEQREYLDIIKQCSDSLLKVLNDLLDFTKMDQGQLQIDPHAFRAKAIIDYLETIFSIPCQKKNIKLVAVLDPNVPSELYGDSHRLRQILSNIVANAIKFTEVGEIRVRFEKSSQDDFYVCEIADTGVGIKQDYLPKIFSPFTQENSGIARSHGGTGLGLAISKKLTELMGGTIEVHSVYGEGTRFTIAIPLQRILKEPTLQI